MQLGEGGQGANLAIGENLHEAQQRRASPQAQRSIFLVCFDMLNIYNIHYLNICITYYIYMCIFIFINSSIHIYIHY